MDLFTLNLSDFDRQARLGVVTGPIPTIWQYLEFVSAQILEWTTEEITVVQQLFDSINEDLKREHLKINYPEEIWLVKTTGNEEGHAAYCRSTDIICLPEKYISRHDLKGIMIHESFHIFSRNNLTLRDQLYSIISFARINTVLYPDSLEKKKITNPDAPFNYHYITFTLTKKTNDPTVTHKETIKVVPILYNDKPYTGGDFFNFMAEAFMVIKKDKKSKLYAPKLVNGQPILYPFPDFQQQYLEKIGHNTEYIIHPEEILADNYMLLVQNSPVPSPQILRRLKMVILADNAEHSAPY